MSLPGINNNGVRCRRAIANCSGVRKHGSHFDCLLLLLIIVSCHHGTSPPCNASFVDIMSFVDNLFGIATTGGISPATAPTLLPAATTTRAKPRRREQLMTSANITMPLEMDKASANDAGTSRGGPGGVLVSVTRVHLNQRGRIPLSPPQRFPNQRRKPTTLRPREPRRPQNETTSSTKKRPLPSSNPSSNPSPPSPSNNSSRRESPLSPPPTKRTARSPPGSHRNPGTFVSNEATTLMPEREQQFYGDHTRPPSIITATTTAASTNYSNSIVPGMPRGNGSSIESVPHVFNPYLGIGPQHNIITIGTSTTTTPAPSVTEQKAKPMVDFINVVAGKPMGLVDVFGMVGGSEPPPPAAAVLPGSSVATPTADAAAAAAAAADAAAAAGGEPVASDGASSNPVVIPTDVTGPPGLEMPAFDIPVTDPKITVNEQNQTGYQQNTWREFLEEIADECPNNDALRAEEIGPERFAHKTNPPKGVTIPASQTTRSPEFFIESVDAGKGGHICLWAKQMLTKMGHVDKPAVAQPGVPQPEVPQPGVPQPSAAPVV